jgi:hypothetical protein
VRKRAAQAAATFARALRAVSPTFALLLGVALLWSTPGRAVERTVNEVWPEIDVYIRLDEHWRVALTGAVTRAAETGVSTETVLGVNLDYFHTALPPAWVRVFPGVEQFWGFTTRIGYNRVIATNPSGPPEDRGVLEATVRSKPLWFDIVLANRNRLDLRLIDDEYSWRGRNRTRIERTWTPPAWIAASRKEGAGGWRPFRSLTPYTMAEFFWDSRTADWSREVYQLGVEFETPRGHSVDLFVVRQYDTRTAGARLTAAGIAVSLRY